MAKNKKKQTKTSVARPFTSEALLKRSIRSHFTRCGFVKAKDGTLVLPGDGKEIVRQLHATQRAHKLKAEAAFLKYALPYYLDYFASGSELDPKKIRFSLCRVDAGTGEADLFRLAALTWSVPVSAGYGRRLRYLVWDEGHDKLAGIIALGDPVFNLSVRDKLIGWDSDDRSDRLVNILDAYVLGAVPPYNMLLTGKAVACLVRSRDIYDDFKSTYGNTVGIISGEAKGAALLAVTTTSSMGRSSVYNRLTLDQTKYFTPIGYTLGWGHFHITDKIFREMREYLREIDHPYADQHEFGEGPNWRLRTIRAALRELGINESVLKHGIKREVFISTFANNSIKILKNGSGRPNLRALKTVEEISDLALQRWIIPRSERRTEFREWKRNMVVDLINNPATSALANRSRAKA